MKEVRIPLPAPVGPSRYDLIAWEFGDQGPLVYLQAGLHADELPGVLVLQRVRRTLAKLEQTGVLKGRVRLVAQANPVGLAQFQLGHHQGRFEAASGRNFNRSYPRLSAAGEHAGSREAARRLLLERHRAHQPQGELAVLQHTLFGWALEADLVLDLHCDSEAVVHLYGNSRQQAELAAVGQRLGAGVVLLAEEAGGMSFDDALMQNWYALRGEADWSVPLAVTVELRGLLDLDEAQLDADAERLLDLLTEQGWLDRPLGANPGVAPMCADLAAVEAVVAPRGGVLCYRVTPGETVAAGDLLAHVEDPVSGERIPLHAHLSGYCYARVLGRLATAGEEVIFIAGREVVRSGDLLGL